MLNKSVRAGSDFHWPFIAAWAFCVIFYFLQYALRLAPGVMVPELTSSFGLSAFGVSSLIALYYYTYSTFAIVSGACFDRYGAKSVAPSGLAFFAVGSVRFSLGIASAAKGGCLRQAAGSIRETRTAALFGKTGDGPKLQVAAVLGAAQ